MDADYKHLSELLNSMKNLQIRLSRKEKYIVVTVAFEPRPTTDN